MAERPAVNVFALRSVLSRLEQGNPFVDAVAQIEAFTFASDDTLLLVRLALIVLLSESAKQVREYVEILFGSDSERWSYALEQYWDRTSISSERVTLWKDILALDDLLSVYSAITVDVALLGPVEQLFRAVQETIPSVPFDQADRIKLYVLTYLDPENYSTLVGEWLDRLKRNTLLRQDTHDAIVAFLGSAPRMDDTVRRTLLSVVPASM